MKGRACTSTRKIHALERLFQAWEKMPMQRLSQLLENVARWHGGIFFYVEDDELLRILEKYTSRAIDNA